MGVYDHMMKVLIDHYPKALTQFVWNQWGPQWPDDSPLAMAEINQVTLLNTEFKTTDLEADSVLLVEGSHGLKCMVQLEFQSRPDELMPLRSLEYCLRAKKKYWDVYGDLPVIAAVIYMFDEEHLPVPPMRWSTPDGQTSLWFSYVSISLPAMPREQLLALHRPELWPLVLLTKEPVDRILVKDMLTGVVEQNLRDMLPLIHTTASWRMKGDDLTWLSQEYQKMFELFRDAPAYQWMKRDATAEARREEKARADEAVARANDEAACAKDDAARAKDDAARAKDDAARTHEEMARAKDDAARVHEEMARVQDEVARKMEKMVRAQENLARVQEEMILQRKQEQRMQINEQRMQINELRQTVVVMTAVRFPELAQLTQTVVWKLTRPQAFLHLFARLSQARDAAEAQRTLQTLLDEEGEADTKMLDERV